MAGSKAERRVRARRSGVAPGRPRNPAVDRAILRAALALFIEHGVAGASIEKIARRAGVARTSVYRRWSSREALMAQAIEVARNAAGFSEEVMDRTPAEDFAQLLLDACATAARPEIRRLMARLIGSVPDWPNLLEVYRDTYYLPRRRAFLRALERVKAAGLLARGTDTEALADRFTGAMMHRLLLAPAVETTPDMLRLQMLTLMREAGFELSRLHRR